MSTSALRTPPYQLAKPVIEPIGNQLIIQCLPPEAVGSIIIPDAAKRITHQGTEEGPGTGSTELQYVNRWLFEDITESIKRIASGMPISPADLELLRDLATRANRSILPKTETGIIPSNGEGLNFVEANVIACGPGKRGKDETLVPDLAEALKAWMSQSITESYFDIARTTHALIARAQSPNARQPMTVKPGDRILYHPSVQKFDREIDPEAIGLEPNSGRCFIIREESVLAVIGGKE